MRTTAPATSSASARSASELARIVVGRPMSLSKLWDLIGRESRPDGADTTTPISLGSVGYERFKTSTEFVATLVRHGITRLIDVRELPISRKRGFAKTALAEALEARGIEYIHEKRLGNPKKFRDLYKTGDSERGRASYSTFLVEERMQALQSLVPLIESGEAALMCVEHDSAVCHRDVIFDALRNQLGLSLAVRQLVSDS